MIKTPTMQELLEAGVHFGHQVRRGNPRMKQYIYGVRDGVHIIDLAHSEQLLKEAAQYVYDLGRSGGTLLLVGTKKQAKPLVEEVAKKTGAFYMIDRWVGGFVTNFEEISKNIKKLNELKEQKSKGQLSKYTKKEQLLIDRKITKLERIFAGVSDITKIPDAVFIIDIVSETTAVKECIRRGVKIVAITDTNSDPMLVDYPIPGNDDAIKSIKMITDAIGDAYEAGKKAAGKTDAEIAKEEKEASKKSKKDAKVKPARNASQSDAGGEEAQEEVVADALLEEVAAAEEEVEKASLEDSERKA